MKKIYLGTNWKMHKTLKEAKSYTAELLQYITEFNQFCFFIIPPYTDLWGIREMIKNKEILLGSQNMHWEAEGAYTGEISPEMLAEIGVDIIELGHSERRQYYNETDFTVNKKVHAALKYGFTTLVCIGEKIAEKEFHISKDYLSTQIKVALAGIKTDQLSKIWIAYEPVWAIGSSGIPADPCYVEEMHNHIRNTLIGLYGAPANEIPILYGGSVNFENSAEYIRLENVDGLFIGRSAWDAKSFYEIMQLIAKTQYSGNI